MGAEEILEGGQWASVVGWMMEDPRNTVEILLMLTYCGYKY